MLVNRINFGSLCLALLLFFLPWTRVQCGDETLATQNGFQAITGKVTSTMNDKDQPGSGKKTGNLPAAMSPGGNSSSKVNDLGSAVVAAIALLVILAGLAVAAVALFAPALLFQNGRPVPVTAWSLAAGALALLLIQAVCFPIDRMVNQFNDQKNQSLGSDKMSKDIAAAMSATSSRSAGFYLELLALAVPVGLHYGAGKTIPGAGPVPRAPGQVRAFPVITLPAPPPEQETGPIPFDEPEL